MVIGEPIYLALLPLVVAIYYLIPQGLPRQVLLLAVSYTYYLTFPATFLAVLLAVTCLACFGARLLERSAEKRHRGVLLATLIAISLLPLAFFKYAVPLLGAGPRGQGASWQLTMTDIVLPIGLSFYTFAAIGYLVDCYLGVVRVERNPLRVALFTGFFPYVTSGPIPRTIGILPQLGFQNSFKAERMIQGVREILIGVVMKFWIADALAVPTSSVYNHLSTTIPLEKFVATVFFAFQLYTDFAGYSLIAIGSARLLGVDMPDNFRQPYLSESLSEFWRRWHISLVSWLRDYFFMPLSLRWRRHPAIAIPVVMFLTLVLVGIWHGMGWGFVAFGSLHGMLLAIGNITRLPRKRLLSALGFPPGVLLPIRILSTFLIVALSLAFIRAQNLTQAAAIYQDIFSIQFMMNLYNSMSAQSPDLFLYIHLTDQIGNLSLIAAVVIGDVISRTNLSLVRMPKLMQGSIYAVCVLTVLYQAISYSTPKLFVYFQF